MRVTAVGTLFFIVNWMSLVWSVPKSDLGRHMVAMAISKTVFCWSYSIVSSLVLPQLEIRSSSGLRLYSSCIVLGITGLACR
jgi:hypothetical protein